MAQHPEDVHPGLRVQLQGWADWSKGGRDIAEYPRVNTLDRIKRLHDNAALCGATIGAGDMPLAVERVEKAIVELPERWRILVVGLWVKRWSQLDAAKRLKTSRQSVHAWRRHAYGELAEKLC